MAKPIMFLLLAASLYTVTAQAPLAAAPGAAQAPGAAAAAATPGATQAPGDAAAGPTAGGGKGAEAFFQCLTERAVPPNIVFAQSNPEFPVTLQNYIRNARGNTTDTLKPLVIVTPMEPAHIQAAVTCSKNTGLQIKTRSGGHDYECVSYVNDVDFFILDMFNMRSVTVDVPAELAVVQCGALLGEVYFNIWNASKAHGFPAGVCPTVGAGGHLSGGGYGNLIRKFGLTVDNIVDAQIVDANGQLLDRKGMGEDLFWAIRGAGGGSFCVVISYTLKLVPVPEKVTVFRVEKSLEEQATPMVSKYQEMAPKTDPDLFMRLLLQPVEVNGQNTIKASILGQFLGDAARLVGITDKEFPELGLKIENCAEITWIQSVLWWGDYDVNVTQPDALLNRNLNTAKFLKRKSDYIMAPIPPEGLEAIWKKMIEVEKVGLVFNACGGKMDEVPPEETPFPYRAGTLFKIQYSISWKDGADTEVNLAKTKDLHSFMTPYVSQNPRGAYLNYRDLDLGINSHGPKSLEEGLVYGPMYFGINYDRLLKVKAAVDPGNLFRNQQSIPVAPAL